MEQNLQQLILIVTFAGMVYGIYKDYRRDTREKDEAARAQRALERADLQADYDRKRTELVDLRAELAALETEKERLALELATAHEQNRVYNNRIDLLTHCVEDLKAENARLKVGAAG